MNIINLVTQIIFYLFAVGAIFSALIVVSTRNPVNGVLALVLTFISMAGIWILLHAEFLALILVVVYVGAVMTLFLFVVMMLNLDLTNLKRGLVRYLPVGLLIVFFILVMLFLVVGPRNFGLQYYSVPMPQTDDVSNVQALGMTLFTHYIYSFEIAGVLLLVSMIAAITLAFRGVRQRKVVKVSDQLAVRREDRVTLVKMQNEQKHTGENA